MKPPRRIKDVKPVYAPESLAKGDEGAIVVEASISASGTVDTIQILWSGCERLEKSALAAVRQWRYEQVRVNGKPVPFKVTASVPFRLPQRFKARAGQAGACVWKEPPKPFS